MAERRGTHPLVWVGVGCLVLVVIGTVALIGTGWFVKNKAEQLVEQIESRPVETAARAWAAINPEVEFVSADEESERVTLRNTRTGEETTVDYSALREGRVVFEGADGSTVVSGDAESGVSVTGADGSTTRLGGGDQGIPDWLPRMPGTQMQASFTTTSGGRSSGTFAVSGRPVDEIVDHFHEALIAAGFEEASRSQVGGAGVLHELRRSDPERQVTLTSAGGQDTVVVTYEGED